MNRGELNQRHSTLYTAWDKPAKAAEYRRMLVDTAAATASGSRSP